MGRPDDFTKAVEEALIIGMSLYERQRENGAKIRE
jgi:hypothetical protein